MTDGFLVQRRRSPVGLGLVIAAHVGVIGALMLSVTHVIAPREIFTPIRSYPVDPPPPPPPQQHLERTAPTHPTAAIDSPKPTIAIPTPTGPVVALDPVTTDVPPLSAGPVGPPIEVKQTPPTPVMVDAALDPRFARDLQPDYPPALERAGTEGRCTVRVRIGSDGRVREVEQIAADDQLFFAATRMQALRHWRFRPATRDGAAVETWKTMTVRFHLQG